MGTPPRENRATSSSSATVILEWFLVAAVFALAVFLRFYRLDTVPTGVLYDEAYNGIDILDILGGARPIFLTANNGREAMFIYLQALSVYVFGQTDWALRIPAAIVGFLTVPTSFFLIRRLYGRRVALLTCAWLAVSLWHVMYSRIGLRTIILPLVLSTSFYCLWRGLTDAEGEAKTGDGTGPRPLRWPGALWFALGGGALGLAQYAYPTARFAPLVVVALGGYLAITNRVLFRRSLPGFVLAAIFAIAVFAPEGVFFLRNPDAFTTRANEVSIFNSTINDGDPTRALMYSTIRSLGMFFFHGDEQWDRNIPGRPVFDPMSSAVGALGLFIILRRVRDPRYFFVVVWIAIMLIPSAISIRNVPNFVRVTGLIPAIFALPAIGANWFWEAWDRRTNWRVRHVPFAVVGVAIVVGASLTYQDYFVRWAREPWVNQTFSSDRWVAIETARRLAATSPVPIYVRGTDRDEELARYNLSGQGRSDRFYTFNGANSLILPAPGAAASYLFATRDIPDEPLRQRYFPDGAGRVVAKTPSGDAITRWDLSALRSGFEPDLPVTAHFGNDFELFGLDARRDVAAGDELTVRAYWKVLETDARDIYFVAQLLDADSKRRSQVDQRALAPAYWPPGTMGISTFHLRLDQNTPTGAYSLILGAYVRQDLIRLPVLDGLGRDAGGQVNAGLIKVHGVSQPNPSVANPSPADLDDQIGFLGADVEPARIRPGGNVTATIFWSARGRPSADYTVFVHLLDAGGRVVAGGDSPPRAGRYPTTVWDSGETIVDSHDLSVDPSIVPGRYALEVGMYLPTTGQRLSVLGSNGQVVGDRILRPGVVVEAD